MVKTEGDACAKSVIEHVRASSQTNPERRPGRALLVASTQESVVIQLVFCRHVSDLSLAALVYPISHQF